LNVDALPLSCINTIADWHPGGNTALDEESGKTFSPRKSRV
jgi:hypothetical protein